MSAHQITLRAIPPKVDEAIRHIAAKEGKSINTVVLESLQNGLGLGTSKVEHRDLDAFFGVWEDDAKYDAAIREFGQIDEEIWQ